MALWRVLKHSIKNTNADFVSLFVFLMSGRKSGIRSATLFLLTCFCSFFTSLSLIISLSLSRARKFICIVKMKTGYSRFPQAGVLRLDFRLRSNANDGNKLPRYYIPTSFHKKNEHLKRCPFFLAER